MANPIIFWDDDSVRLEPVTSDGLLYVFAPFPDGNLNYPVNEDDNQKAIGILTSRRSTDRTRLPFSINYLPDENLTTDDLPDPVYVAIFGTGMRLEIADERGRGLLGALGNELIQYVETDSVAAKILSPFNHAAFDANTSNANTISKWGNSQVVEIIASRNAIELPKPPQENAFPAVADKWETFPRVSVRGDFLGSSYRPIAGELDISIEMVSNAWIREKWEPFREHISKGGIFAYAIDWENDPTNVAYCYASENVPAPVVKAGGYGDVKAMIGVTVI